MTRAKEGWFSVEEFDWETSIETRKVGKIEKAYRKIKKYIRILCVLLIALGVLLFFFGPEFDRFIEVPDLVLNKNSASISLISFGILTFLLL